MVNRIITAIRIGMNKKKIKKKGKPKTFLRRSKTEKNFAEDQNQFEKQTFSY